MCGIAAVVGPRASAAVAERMADRLGHRGPDSAGVWTADGVALGFRRLSILDLSSAADQPMASHCGRYQMVYNGEIFNYRELAARLPDTRWRTTSDSEVLLESFAARGPACLDELVGMYAFAIWDRDEHRLFCARDRLGIKPMLYARLDDSWVVASEIGALLAAGVRARADEAVIYDFLARDFYEHGDATFFDGVRKLPAGHWTWLSSEREPAPVRYWDLAAEAARIEVPNDREARGEQLVAMMSDAVAISLRSDVPVGITLSGGLDSATLLALIDRVHPSPERIAAFSFAFADERYSERPWVERMASHTGHPVAVRVVTPDDFVAGLDRGIAQQQEPHAGLPILAYELCFELLRARGVIVAMDGSGLDEGLAGYDRFRPARWADLFAAAEWSSLERELRAVGIATTEGRRRVCSQLAAATSEHGDVGRGQDLTASVRPDCLGEAFAGTPPPLPVFERPFDDALRNLMYRELRYTKLPRALRFRDRLSMAHGTELRPPFLDHRLLAYLFALPAEDRIRDGATKSLLRDAATRLLPDAVRLASKRSVQTPQREWFRGELAGWLRDRLAGASLWERGWVDRDAALAALARFQAGEGDNSFFIWQWIALDRWAEMFLEAEQR